MKIKGLHHFAYRCRDAEETRHFYEDVLGLPLAHLIKMDNVPSTGEYCPYVAGIEVLGVTDHHIIQSIYFFDPNGIRLELTVRAIEEEEMKRLGGDARAQLDRWTKEKATLRRSA